MSSANRKDLTRAIVDVCRRMAAAGYVVASEGNVSARLRTGNILLTGTGITKRSLTRSDILEISPGGMTISGTGTPSSEMGMHLFIYAKRPDVGAIVHAHPVTATGFASARVPIPVNALPEVIVEMRKIPLAPYATPSTGEVAGVLAKYVKDSSVFLLANHGVVACGRDLDDAYSKLERLEHAARIMFVAKLLGGEKPLTGGQIDTLLRTRVAGRGPAGSKKVKRRAGPRRK